MIKFTINKNAFQQALKITRQAIGSKVAIPALSKLKITIADDGIHLTGSNGQISIENYLSSEDKDANMVISGTGSILLEAAFFESVIAQLPDVSFEFEELEQYQVKLNSGKSEIILKGLDSEIYPRIQEIPSENPLKINVGELKEIFAETSFAVSTQESRPIFTGVHLILENASNLTAVATDSHRLSQRNVTLENSSDDFNIVLPKKSIDGFKNVFANDEENVEIFLNNNQLLIKNDSINFYTRLIEGNYPDTNRLIPNASDYTLDLTFDVAELQHTMTRAKLLASSSTNGTVKLTVNGEQIITTANSPEVGSVHEELNFVEKSGSDLAISFNPQYLIDALRVIKTPQVSIQLISNVRPFTLQPKAPNADSDFNFVQLITPVRTN